MFQHVKATADSLQRPYFPTMNLDGNQDFLLQSLLLTPDFSRHSTLNWQITYSATTRNVIGLCSLQYLGHNSTSFCWFVSIPNCTRDRFLDGYPHVENFRHHLPPFHLQQRTFGESRVNHTKNLTKTNQRLLHYFLFISAGNRVIRLPKYLFLHQIRSNYLPVLCITLSKIIISLPSHPCPQIILWPVLIRLKINKIPSHFSCFLAADVYSFLLFLLSNHFFSFAIHVYFSREAMPFTRCLGCQIFVL